MFVEDNLIVDCILNFLSKFRIPNAEVGHCLYHVGHEDEKQFQEGGPSCLPPIQNVSRGEVDEVLVISHHLNIVLGACQVRLPFFKGGNNGRKFFVVNWVVDLGGCALPRVKGNRMKDFVFIWLRENDTNSKVRGTRFNCKWFGQIWV